MSNKKKYNEIKHAQMESAHKFKADIKRVAICILCLFPVFVVLSYLLNELKLPLWLIMIINVVIGGGICFLVFTWGERKYEKEKAKELLDNEKDPFKD